MYLLLLVSQLTPGQHELIIPPPVVLDHHAHPIPSVGWVPHDHGFFPHGPPLPYYIPPGGPWGIGMSWQRRAPSFSHHYTTAESPALPPPTEKKEDPLPMPKEDNGDKGAQDREVCNRDVQEKAADNRDVQGKESGNRDVQNRDAGKNEAEKQSPNQGRIVIEIPEDSTLYVNDLQVNLSDTRGTLLTADLVPGKKYVYDLKIEVRREGKTLTQSRKVTISAGEAVFVMFDDPVEVQTIQKLP